MLAGKSCPQCGHPCKRVISPERPSVIICGYLITIVGIVIFTFKPAMNAIGDLIGSLGTVEHCDAPIG